MSQRKPYNPNTKYGRKKLREQNHLAYQNMTPDEKSEHNSCVFIITIIIIIVFGGFILLIGGPEALFKWLSN